ncbi:hypothetical protein [Allomuricauda sp. NBRC 101325]|uniref:hypothetical protein n=1 Tax=Allomuricauda sp. NBRC 101325 TaxID=1113758 RepID=UPI0025549EFA|nr:hypothetical protein [Muricauda sp. NBRC 101325]
MKKLILILFFGLSACKTGFDYTSTYSTSKECVEKEQMKTLEKTVELFESKIENQYPEISREAAYFKFISDWANNELPMNFFKDSLELKIRSLNIWAESNRSEKELNMEKKLYNVDTMNPIRVKLNPDFSVCLANKVDWMLGTSSFLRANSKYRISPKLAKKQLYKTSEYDLKIFENRLTIVLGVYYQTMFNIKTTVVNTLEN